MASLTKEKRAQLYADRIASKNKNQYKNELDAILQEINGLVYTKSEQPVSLDYKRELINEISKCLVTKSLDNQNYLELVNYMLAQIENDDGGNK